MRIDVPPPVSRFIAARIANYRREATRQYHLRESGEVAEFAALPLIRHWYETIGLRADGEFVRWSNGDGDEPYVGVRPVEERYDWLWALVEGAERWPELAAVLPVRPPNAVACQCAGLEESVRRKFLCGECCGLRWVVP